MAARPIQIRVVNPRELQKISRAIRRIDPRKNVKIINDGLKAGALRVKRNAQQRQMKRGGSGPPLPSRLTSRTGTGRRSINVDRSGLPRHIDVGPNVRYMATHEFGGTFTVRSHSRSKPSGGRARVKAHSRTVPRRAYLEPAYNAEKANIVSDFMRRWDQALRESGFR